MSSLKEKSASLGIRTGGLTTQSFGWLAKKHRCSENEVRDLDKRYKAADLDRSGQLDKQELRTLLKSTIASAASEAGLTKFLDSQWHNVDRDGNGTVDFDEFLSLYAVLKAAGPNADPTTKAPSKGAKAPAGAAAGAAGAAAGAKPAAGAATGAKGAKGGKAAKAGLGVKKQKKQKTKSTKKVVRKSVSFTPKAALSEQNYVTNEIVWSAIRTNNAFLVKRGRVVLSGDKGNLRNTHSRTSSGLANHRNIDLSNVEGGLNIRLTAPSKRRANQPVRRYTTQKLVRDNRGVARQIRSQLKKYRSSQTKAALARMSRLKATAPGVVKRTQRVRTGRRAANQPAAAPASNTTTTAASTQTSAQ